MGAAENAGRKNKKNQDPGGGRKACSQLEKALGRSIRFWGDEGTRKKEKVWGP